MGDKTQIPLLDDGGRRSLAEIDPALPLLPQVNALRDASCRRFVYRGRPLRDGDRVADLGLGLGRDAVDVVTPLVPTEATLEVLRHTARGSAFVFVRDGSEFIVTDG
jgi:hypothetical protein